jgi:hypothetical protein
MRCGGRWAVADRWAALLLASGLGATVAACEDAAEELECLLDVEPESTPAPLYTKPTPCDPHLAPAKTPTIQPPAAVGVADDDTMYVIDRLDRGLDRPEVPPGATERIFVAEGDTLVRKPGGLGGAESTADFIYRGFGFGDPSVWITVRVQRKPGFPRNIIPAETSMAIMDASTIEGGGLSDVFELGMPLRVESECTAAGYDVEDLPQGRHIEYVAEDENGNEILVTVPAVDWDVQSCKLFYGPPDAVLERPVRSFARERDGGTTHIAFVLDGQEATLHFVVGCNGPFTHDCEGSLELPAVTSTVSIPSRDEAMLVGNTYVCHDQPPPP